MPESDAVDQARSLLVRRRGELTAELQRVTQALAALNAAGGSDRQTLPRRSVRAMLLALLEEHDRDWSASEILREYQDRGTPVHGADPSNALRSATADAHKAGQIVRTGVGRYKAAKWQASEHLPTSSGDAAPSPPDAIQEISAIAG